MWDTVLPNTSCSWEPVELRLLKQELAHLACKCHTCETFRNPSLYDQRYQSDEAVQVEQKQHLLDKYIYATAENDESNMMDYFRSDIFCPNCYFIWDLLRRTTKVFKDQSSEMKPDSSDKSTEKPVNIAGSVTSVTNGSQNKTPLPMASNLTLCDFISDCSSASSHSTRDNNPVFKVIHPNKKKINHDRVTFLDDYSSKHEVKEEAPNLTIHGNCFCLENLVDSIRPPLKNAF